MTLITGTQSYPEYKTALITGSQEATGSITKIMALGNTSASLSRLESGQVTVGSVIAREVQGSLVTVPAGYCIDGPILKIKSGGGEADDAWLIYYRKGGLTIK